jgi:2-iminobutanoate/2-iminopropanoate deaminase
MTLRAINAAGAPKPIAPYSPAIDTGGLVFVSGQIGADPATGELLEGVAAQAERVVKNIVAILDAAGLTLSDVAKTTCFLADINDFNEFNEVYARYFGEPKPARSTYAVAALPKGARVEIEAIAVRG